MAVMLSKTKKMCLKHQYKAKKTVYEISLRDVLGQAYRSSFSEQLGSMDFWIYIQ